MSTTPTTAATAKPQKQRVVLAYSGGLDTSVMVKWLQVEKDLDVVAICVNVGQESQDLGWVKQKALDMGAIAAEAVDLRDLYADQFLTKAIAANGLYEGTYPLLSALSRPLISAYMVDAAHKYGAAYVAHGCTGKGNDQVRFETSIQALDPSIAIIAPVREWDLLTREQEMEWAKEHGVPVPTTIDKPYSIDDNLFGRAIECGVLENPWNEPPADIWTMTADPQQASDVATEVVIGFEKGKPVSLNGEKKSLFKIIIELNAIAGANGYGRIDMIEDRVVGIKSRECYECPASLALIAARPTRCMSRRWPPTATATSSTAPRPRASSSCTACPARPGPSSRVPPTSTRGPSRWARSSSSSRPARPWPRASRPRHRANQDQREGNQTHGIVVRQVRTGSQRVHPALWRVAAR